MIHTLGSQPGKPAVAILTRLGNRIPYPNDPCHNTTSSQTPQPTTCRSQSSIKNHPGGSPVPISTHIAPRMHHPCAGLSKKASNDVVTPSLPSTKPPSSQQTLTTTPPTLPFPTSQKKKETRSLTHLPTQSR